MQLQLSTELFIIIAIAVAITGVLLIRLQSLSKLLAAAAPEITFLRTERTELKDRIVALEEELSDQEKAAARMSQQVEDLQREKQDFEKYKDEFKQFAKSSVADAGTSLSKQLLQQFEEKQQQSLREKAESEKRVMDRFNKASEFFAGLQKEVKENSQSVETLMRSLSHPGGAGALAEVGLENSLKNLGLEPGRDFIMQYHTGEAGAGLRPDAVVFLPRDMVMVIDSKASKFLLELAEAEGTEAEAEVIDKLTSRMQDHLKELAKKDYRNAVAAALKSAGEGRALGKMLNVMYLPSDAALEKMRIHDPSFMERAEKADIIPVGGAGLYALLNVAKQEIASAQQQENMQEIMSVTGQLIDAAGTAFGHIDSVGKSIKSTAEHFDKFARSLNRGLLPKLRKSSQMGVSHKKEVPANVMTYEVIKKDEVIELDAEEAYGDEKIGRLSG